MYQHIFLTQHKGPLRAKVAKFLIKCTH